MANKLVGQNYTTPDLVAKVTGKAKYSEDYKAEGMLYARLLLSPLPHARARNIDISAAQAMPGVKAILLPSDIPAPADIVTDLGQTIKASTLGEKALTDEPVYQGEPVLAVAAVDERRPAQAESPLESRRYSQARAYCQLRYAVRADMPRTSAARSMVSPAKT